MNKKYNVLIFGTGTSAVYLESGLDKNKVNIIGYIDNNKGKQDTYYKEKNIYAPIEAINMDFDYILIASQYNDEILTQLLSYGIDYKKIFQFFLFLNVCGDNHKRKINLFLQNENYELLCTGISYAAIGFQEKVCSKKSFNFALGSQDLYYDYNIIKYLFETHPYKVKKVKYCIIGLSYYSFQYDLSLSAMKYKCYVYRDTINKYNNYNIDKNFEKYFEASLNIFNNICLKGEEKLHTFNRNKIYKESIVKEEIKDKGRVQAEGDCNKNYPNTVIENKKIFKEYIEFLKAKNIKPIIVVFPAMSYYTKYFSKKIELEFKEIISEFKKEYDFQYIDCFRMENFDNKYFADVSHLNKEGGEEFTRILNEKIIW